MTRLRQLVVSLILVSSSVLLWAQGEKLGEELQVSRELLDVRVLDVGGNPILNLDNKDFELKIDGKRVPIETTLWIEPGAASLNKLKVAPGEQDDPVLEDVRYGREPIPNGRLITIFIQSELTGNRIAAYLQLPRFMKTFLEQLHEDDYIAVYGYGSHLKLHCDFTRDRDVALDAIRLAARRSKELAFMAPNSPSLGPYFNEEDAKNVATPEDALAHIAKNLEVFPGNKTLIYLGYGFGRFSNGNVYMEPEYKRAVFALNSARINVFSVDITRADYHPLEQGMRRIAEDTGGAYYSARVFPGNAMRRVVNAIAGYYRIVFQYPSDLDENANFRLELKNRKGRLYVRNPYNGAPEL